MVASPIFGSAPLVTNATSFLRRERLAFRLKNDPLGVGFDKTRAAQTGRVAGGGGDVRKRKAVGGEPVRMELNLQLPDVAAEDGNAGHAFDAEQTRAQGPIGESAEFHRRADVRGEADNQREAGGSDKRRHGRGLHALRQLRGRFGHAFGDHLTGAVNVDLVFESGDDDG